MAELLSVAWVEEAARVLSQGPVPAPGSEIPGSPGSGVLAGEHPGTGLPAVQVVVGEDRKRAQATWWWARGVDGPAVGAGSRLGCEVTVTVSAADLAAIIGGELRPAVAFMQGRLKVDGPVGEVLALLACTATGGFEVVRERLAAVTDGS